MPQILEVIGPKSGAAPLVYRLTELGTVGVQSVFAHFNGAAAAGSFRPALTIRAQDGTILARLFPSETLAAGDTADVTYAPFLRGGAAAAGGGIQFETNPQEGGWLVVTTTDLLLTYGMILQAQKGRIEIQTLGPDGGTIEVDSHDNLNLNAENDIHVNAFSGFVDVVAPAVQITTDPGNIDIEAHGGGELHLHSEGGFGGFIDISAAGGTVVTAASEIVDRMETFGSWKVQNGAGTINRLRITDDGFIIAQIATGKKLEVLDNGGAAIFRINPDGSLQGKTGQALTFNL